MNGMSDPLYTAGDLDNACAAAFERGKAEGHDVGHKIGWDSGHAVGYAEALDEVSDALNRMK